MITGLTINLIVSGGFSTRSALGATQIGGLPLNSLITPILSSVQILLWQVPYQWSKTVKHKKITLKIEKYKINNLQLVLIVRI